MPTPRKRLQVPAPCKPNNEESGPGAHGGRSKARSGPGARGVRSRAHSGPGARGNLEYDFKNE